ncbi:MAG: hypothetical protein WBN48_18365, partial [Thiogranum sp.]
RRSSGGEGALGYKVNCRQAREGALGYKVNCRQARQGESPPGERRSSGGEGALGYHARYDCLNPTDFQDQIMDIREVER